MAVPFLTTRDITVDALPAQRTIATYLVERQAYYHFTVKGNQPALERAIALLFETRGAPDFVEVAPPDHWRIETRRIWCGPALNAYLDFPHIGQVFMIERESNNKKTGAHSREIALGITSRNRPRPNAYWPSTGSIGASQAFITSSTGTCDEDRRRIRTARSPENIIRLRRFAVGILKSFQKPAQSIAAIRRKLTCKTRLVFDDLRMTQNSITRSPAQ